MSATFTSRGLGTDRGPGGHSDALTAGESVTNPAGLRRWTRVVIPPTALVICAGATFSRAFDSSDLITATIISVVLGGVAAGLVTRWRPRVGWVAAVQAPVVLIVFAVLGAMLSGRTGFRPGDIPDALNTFLLVGLPSPGLDQLGIVVFIVLYPAMVISVWASFRDRTLTTLAAPLAAVAVAELLVAPVGSSRWVPVVFGLVAAAVLIVDLRNDLTALPPLIGTGTELRRQSVWWRPVAQIAPALAAAMLVVTVVPMPATFDLRQFVNPGTIRVDDANPLAVASHWRQADDPSPVMKVRVDGPTPGRLRAAVLGGYSDIGWEQAGAYQITGDRFAADPLYPTGIKGAADTTVTVEPEGASRFRSLPSAGMPRRTTDPVGLRYAPGADMIYSDDPGRGVSYDTEIGATAPPVTDEPTLASYPVDLATCPDSPGLRAIASQLTADTTSALARVGQIENWLLTRRIYDPSAPGGQTLGSVEQFISQPFARGNLEMFVTTYALLVRCAGLPARVVVGYPAPARGASSYDRSDVTAWVEVPFARSGWVPFDPLPTPEEQRLQAQLATSPTTTTPAVTPPKGPAPRTVAPQAVATTGFPWIAVVLAVLLVGLVLAWALFAPGLIRRRRRRLADPSIAVMAAWTTVAEDLIDRNVDVAAALTPSEVVRACSGRVPVSVPGLIGGMAPIVDRVRYSGRPAADEDADITWAYADAIGTRLPDTNSSRWVALAHPVRTWRRLRWTAGRTYRAEPWRTELPATAMISSADAPDDIPEVSIDARIGDGSTGTVYRGVHLPTGERVAIKVFRYGPADPGFDEHRFEWEVRIAREVSGLSNLPRVVAAGITPESGRPFLVSTLYENGTLLDRVRSGGPLTSAQALALGGDLSVALDSLHQLGVIHADVKPENVFASTDGWVLGDLGSAWLRASHGPAASITPPYAAPEVWRGAAPTPASDLYSLVLTMLFAATGQIPVAGNPPAPDDVMAAFPGEPILLRALDPDSRRRPRSISELGRRLRPGRFARSVSGESSVLGLPTPTITHPRG